MAIYLLYKSPVIVFFKGLLQLLLGIHNNMADALAPFFTGARPLTANAVVGGILRGYNKYKFCVYHKSERKLK